MSLDCYWYLILTKLTYHELNLFILANLFNHHATYLYCLTPFLFNYDHHHFYLRLIINYLNLNFCLTSSEPVCCELNLVTLTYLSNHRAINLYYPSLSLFERDLHHSYSNLIIISLSPDSYD